MSVDVKKTMDKKLLFKWTVCIILSLVPFLFQINDIYTVSMQRFLVVTILGIGILAFELMNGFAVAIMMPTLWLLTGVCNYATAFSSWTSSTSMMLIGAMVLVTVFQKIGLLNRIGYWCIVRAGGTFTGIIWGMYFASLLMMVVGFAMTSILTFAFAYALYRALELKPTDKESFVIVWTIALAGIYAAVYLYCPIAVSLMNTSIQAVRPEITIHWYDIIVWNAPSFFISILLVWGALKWYKISNKGQEISAIKGKEHFEAAYAKLGKMTNNEKKGVVILVFVALYLFTQPLHNLDAAYAFMIATVIFFFSGVNMADRETIRDIPWENIFVIMAFLAVGNVGASVGLNQLISSSLVPIVAAMGSYWSIFGTLMMSTASNFIISPFAMLAMLPAPIAQYCTDAGYNIMPHLYAMYQAKDIIFFPYEYPNYLMLFSFGMVGMGSMIKICTIKSLFVILGFVAIYMPIWYFLGVI